MTLACIIGFITIDSMIGIAFLENQISFNQKEKDFVGELMHPTNNPRNNPDRRFLCYLV